MIKTLIHRGPDDEGHWIHQEEGIALGHRRLSIIDLSERAHQPMHSQQDRFVISYNGEIYNFLLLKKALQKEGVLFSGHADTEVILALLTHYGLEATLEQLIGMFAFAVWDRQEKCLHLVRDRMGEKPLYYGFIQGHFIFASELKAITTYPGFHPVLSKESITYYMQYGYIPAPYSIYDHIYKLMPGSFLTVSRKTLNTPPAPQQYWSATQHACLGVQSPLSLSDQEAIDQTEQRLHDIIRYQMISDRPIGTFLSGGLDSSLITAMMQNQQAAPVQTFTIGFNEPHYNEAPFAAAIAKHLHTDHTALIIHPAQVHAVIEQLPFLYDEPFADASAIPTYLVAQLAKAKVTVCLSGDGGDELFSGYNRYLLAHRLWKKITLLPYPIRYCLQKLLLSVPPHHLHTLFKYTKIPHIGDKLHKLGAILTATSPFSLYEQLIFQWPLADNVTDHHELPLLQQYAFKKELHFIENMMLTDMVSYLPDDILVKVDRASMAVSLETRAPYLDHHLIEFVWQLPLSMKQRHHQSKWLLHQILSRYVPCHLFQRPKMGFGLPLEQWLRAPLKKWAEHLLDPRQIQQQGFLKVTPILEKWQAHLSGKRNWQYALWTILMFQAWLQQHGFSHHVEI